MRISKIYGFYLPALNTAGDTIWHPETARWHRDVF